MYSAQVGWRHNENKRLGIVSAGSSLFFSLLIREYVNDLHVSLYCCFSPHCLFQISIILTCLHTQCCYSVAICVSLYHGATANECAVCWLHASPLHQRFILSHTFSTASCKQCQCCWMMTLSRERALDASIMLLSCHFIHSQITLSPAGFAECIAVISIWTQEARGCIYSLTTPGHSADAFIPKKRFWWVKTFRGEFHTRWLYKDWARDLVMISFALPAVHLSTSVFVVSLTTFRHRAVACRQIKDRNIIKAGRSWTA